MTAVAFGALGLIVGSFLNVLILRYGESLGGRSACMSCGAQIRWYDLIPVVSWLALGGRCRACKVRISLQYPLVEAATGITFALIGGAPISLPFVLLALPIASLLIAIFVYDLYYMLIPDVWAYLLAGCSLAGALLAWWGSGDGIVPIILAGPATALPIFFLWMISRGRWMGFGDVKLTLSFGWLLGIVDGLYAVFAAFVVGAVVGVLLLIVSSDRWKRIASRVTHMPLPGSGGQGYTMKSEVPFGPFLIISCLFVWFMHLYNIPLPLGLAPW